MTLFNDMRVRRGHNNRRIILRADPQVEHDIRLYAEYVGKTVQEITREWWVFVIKRAEEKKLDFRGASKAN